ncbi:hypothetical protein FHL15_011385 [Xylaria flabelliformis]|uniref:Uncharacterized protein n=1 Tax=Xylaria flabelliformis TaxID=2512241 RepID=A0A553HIF2_9PEZI|nr:hypothetical protein FHL15_011385 [Xylaria flabelliformis]
MAAQLRYGGAMPKFSPPPYESFIPDGQDPWQPELESDSIWKINDQEPMIMIFLYCPNPSREWRIQDWVALMYVTCSAFPHPICKGFFWGSSNVEFSAFMAIDVVKGDSRQNEQKWAGSKRYLIRDLQQPRRWLGKIQVFALDHETLRLFDVNQLSHLKIQFGEAFCPYRRRVYRYSYGKFRPRHKPTHGDTSMEESWLRLRMVLRN